MVEHVDQADDDDDAGDRGDEGEVDDSTDAGEDSPGAADDAPRLGNSLLGGIDFSMFAPKFDFSAFAPKIDYSALAPKIDYNAMLPRIDLGPLFDAAAFAPKIDYSLFAPNIDFSAFLGGIDFANLLAGLDLSAYSGVYPPNWPLDLDLDVVAEVISDDGIPLVWVPRQAIVEDVLDAPDRPGRVAILLEHVVELVEDCRLALDQVTDPDLAGQLPLARAAVDALANGHQESAQALATVLTETLVASAVSNNYKEVKEQVLFDVENTSWHQLRLRAAFAPVYRFYTAWYRSWGTPAPEALSRHVTVHEADTAHYTPANALLAVLLVTSVARAVQELNDLGRRHRRDDAGEEGQS